MSRASAPYWAGERVAARERVGQWSTVGRAVGPDVGDGGVPATTANLGAGFDCLALALDLSNTITVEALDGPGPLELAVDGEGGGTLDASGSDRCTQGSTRPPRAGPRTRRTTTSDLDA